MIDREKVVNAVKTAFDVWIDEYTGCSWFKEDEVRQAKDDALSLLKEQENLGTELTNAVELIHKKNERIEKLLKEQNSEKKRIMKVIWDTLHEGLSIDTVADQDWVYERIRHRIEDT